ncbi:hypothetical protein ACFZDG_35800 [Kitasatospora xanthocidica]|uniref:hypothetical protein n=1 Tax=Kitasatospora xanthocidica TaxID=83382 RepID=UPI0036EE3567
MNDSMNDSAAILAGFAAGLRSSDSETRTSTASAVLEAAGAAALTIEQGPGALAALAAYDNALEARDLLPFPQEEESEPVAGWDAAATRKLARLLEVVAVQHDAEAQVAADTNAVYRLSRISLLARRAGQALAAAGSAG